jgi:hypothetical protein
MPLLSTPCHTALPSQGNGGQSITDLFLNLQCLITCFQKPQDNLALIYHYSQSPTGKGGGPGEVIISQTGGTTMFGSAWLCTDPSHGHLMTKLMEPNPSLQSESAVADGEWHHIGLVYDLDALRRHLYVDGAEVAKDTTIVGWVPSDRGLHFGAAKDLDAASFFSGLIDDAKIYNRAIVP